MRPKIILILSFFFICILMPSHGLALKEKIRAGVPPFSILEKIITTNQAAQAPSSRKQAPLVTWLASSDPRIQANSILTDPPTSLYPIRNLGGIFQLALGSLDHGIHNMRTPLLLITGNTDSQAIQFLTENEGELTPSLKKDLKSLTDFLEQPGNSTNEAAELTEKWVDYQVEQAMGRYRHRIDTHRLIVLGGIIDLANFYDRGIGSLIIINVNGETDSNKLQHLPIMRRLNEENLDFVGRSGVSIFKTDSKFSPSDGAEDSPGDNLDDDLPMFSPQHDTMPEYLEKY